MAARYYFGKVRLVPGKGFVATFPDLPEFTVSGNSVDEVKEACEQALTLHLQSLSEQGKEIPLPKTEMYESPYQELGEFRILISGDVPDEDPPLLILRNAQRLLREANLLFRCGSMATTVALSISAIEEAGKLILYFDLDRIAKKKGRADHRDKQRVLARHFDNLFLFEALMDFVTDCENHLRVTGQTELLDQLLQMSQCERLQTAYSAMRDDRSGLQKLIRRVAGKEEHSIDYSRNVEGNRVSEKREQALYVDVRNGKIMPSPFDITFDEAGEWLERAGFAVSLSESLLRDKRESG